MRGLLEDEQLEHALTQGEMASVLATCNALRINLARHGLGELAWIDVPDPEPAPDSFVALVEKLARLEHVVFTGDEEITLALDEHNDTGVWAAKSWQALTALEDYARFKADVHFKGNVDRYLHATPPGGRGFPAQRHAQDESESVKKNPHLRSARTFYVPRRVDPTCQSFMAAHFKIAQYARISPRLHYCDATTVDGKIYVGHLGPHLPTGTAR